MEDMARLAQVEQNIRDPEKFSKLLYELLRLINLILGDPHDYELRTFKSDFIKKHLNDEALTCCVDYLKYIGFVAIDDDMTYPKDQPLSNLRIAQAAIVRKIEFCCGNQNTQNNSRPKHFQRAAMKPKLSPVNVLSTQNPILSKLESLFNMVLKYEEADLQREALAVIPLPTLQRMAVDRVREHQRQIKTGEIKTKDLPFDIALLIELVSWFKESFFSWVDKPECERCGGGTSHLSNSVRVMPTETCNVELYRCTQCPGRAEFPRYNDPRTLLRTRRGRCGEWANCFTLLCRALAYDTRYVYDTTDHVWCEVYDFDSKTWLHVDPCEAVVNKPLLYSAGWGKKLSYVIGVSCEDLQDVTWRYTTEHKQVLKRRTLCSESELLDAILALRSRRQRQVSEARRRFLQRRTLEELVQMLVERAPADYECLGRTSGAAAWRAARCEAGAARREWVTRTAGAARLRYCCATDLYQYDIASGGGEDEWVTETTLSGWGAGAFAAKDVFRKVEKDWEKVYIAREEGTESGFISWRLACAPGLALSSLCARAAHAEFESGRVRWTVRFDNDEPVPADIGESPVRFSCRCRSVELRASLAGGAGARAWQHAQLFRQPAGARAPALELAVTAVGELDQL